MRVWLKAKYIISKGVQQNTLAPLGGVDTRHFKAGNGPDRETREKLQTSGEQACFKIPLRKPLIEWGDGHFQGEGLVRRCGKCVYHDAREWTGSCERCWRWCDCRALSAGMEFGWRLLQSTDYAAWLFVVPAHHLLVCCSVLTSSNTDSSLTLDLCQSLGDLQDIWEEITRQHFPSSKTADADRLSP